MRDNNVFVFLGGQDILRGVFDSHNVAFLSNLYSCGFFPFSTVIMTIIVKENMNDEELSIVNKKTRLLIDTARDNNVDLRIRLINSRKLKNVLKTAKTISNEIQFFDRKFIWAHNYYNGLIGSILRKRTKNAFFHLDLKGLPAEEELIYSDSSFSYRAIKYLSLKTIGAYGIRCADSVSVVSNRYKSNLCTTYSLDSDLVSVLPSVFDAERFYYDADLRSKYRRKYGIKDNQIFLLYSGSLQKWQQPASIFHLYENLSREDTNDTFRFIFLTFQCEEARHLSQRFCIPGLVIESAEGIDLTGSYNAADVGVICRKNDPVNNFASPTKVAEYLATKNSILLTESVGDYGLMLAREPYAIVKRSIDSFKSTSQRDVLALARPSSKDLEKIDSLFSSDLSTSIHKNILFENM